MTNNTRFKIQTYTKLLVHIEDPDEKERIIHMIEDLIEGTDVNSDVNDRNHIFEWCQHIKELNNFNNNQLVDYLTDDKEVLELWREYRNYYREKEYNSFFLSSIPNFSRVLHMKFDLISQRRRTQLGKITYFVRRY